MMIWALSDRYVSGGWLSMRCRDSRAPHDGLRRLPEHVCVRERLAARANEPELADGELEIEATEELLGKPVDSRAARAELDTEVDERPDVEARQRRQRHAGSEGDRHLVDAVRAD